MSARGSYATCPAPDVRMDDSLAKLLQETLGLPMKRKCPDLCRCATITWRGPSCGFDS